MNDIRTQLTLPGHRYSGNPFLWIDIQHCIGSPSMVVHSTCKCSDFVLMFHKCYCHPESERNQKTWRMYKTNRTLHVLINPIPAFLIQWECNSAGISHSWQIKWILHMILLNILFPGLMAGSDPCLDDMIRFVSLMKMVIVASDQQ